MSHRYRYVKGFIGIFLSSRLTDHVYGATKTQREVLVFSELLAATPPGSVSL